MEDNNLVTIKEAAQLVGKCESTLRKLIQKGKLKCEKLEEGEVKRVYIDKRELLNTYSRISKMRGGNILKDSTENSLGNSIGIPMVVANPKKENSYLASDRIIKYLEAENERLKKECDSQLEEIHRLNEKIDKLGGENKALNEEIKGLLRQGQTKKRGIMGYLVEKIMN